LFNSFNSFCCIIFIAYFQVKFLEGYEECFEIRQNRSASVIIDIRGFRGICKIRCSVAGLFSASISESSIYSLTLKIHALIVDIEVSLLSKQESFRGFSIRERYRDSVDVDVDVDVDANIDV
jgi:hypothetical protein